MQPGVRKRKTIDFLFGGLGLLLLVLAFGVLLTLVGDLMRTGLTRIDSQFLTSYASRNANEAGILAAWVGSIAVIIVTVAITIPLGVATGIYLEEYAAKNKFTSILEINIANLAGVPSIVYGLMALGLLVRRAGLGQSVLTAGLTLGLLVLPIVIVATRESIRTIPQHLREAAYAVGATRWQMVWDHVLPYSMGGILTGVIIAVSRAIGETAPLITIGALSFVAFLPHSPLTATPPFVSFQWLNDAYTVLPIQMFNWVSRPQEEFHRNAAAAGVVLIGLTLTLNLGAIVIRQRFRNRIRW